MLQRGVSGRTDYQTEGDRMTDRCPKHQAVELLRRTRGPDAARHADQVLSDPVDLRRDAALLVSLGLTMEQMMTDLGASP